MFLGLSRLIVEGDLAEGGDIFVWDPGDLFLRFFRDLKSMRWQVQDRLKSKN